MNIMPNVIMLNVIMPNDIMPNGIMLNVIILTVIMLNVTMLSVFMVNIFMLSVVAPLEGRCLLFSHFQSESKVNKLVLKNWTKVFLPPTSFIQNRSALGSCGAAVEMERQHNQHNDILHNYIQLNNNQHSDILHSNKNMTLSLSSPI
jgi:hypothetical protein